MAAASRAEPVRTARDWKDFLELPYKLHAGDPRWVPPLRHAERDLFDPARNPFYEHARSERFLLRDGGRLLGRIAVVKDDLAGGRGTFGFLEAVDDPYAFAELFTAARGWLAAQGVARATGPFDPSINYRCGLLVESRCERPGFFMPCNPDYYAKRVEEAGLAPVQDLVALRAKSEEITPEGLAEPMARFASQPGMTMRRMRLGGADLEAAYHIYQKAWQANWGAAPMTRAEFLALFRSMRPLVPRRHAFIAECRGSAIGVLIAVRDQNDAFRTLRGRIATPRLLRALPQLVRPRGLRVLLAGVLPSQRRSGVGGALIGRGAQEWAADPSVEEVEMGWMLEQNPVVAMSAAVGGRVGQRYRLYELCVAS
jgi:hypothetical protein